MQKYSPKLKKECLKLFLEGKQLHEIAELKQIPFETIKSWHRFQHWKQEKEKNYLKTTEKVNSLVAQVKAEEKYDVRQKTIENANRLEKLVKALFGETEEGEQQFQFQVKLNPIHVAMVMNVLQRYLFNIAKIDGLIVDKSKAEGEINIAYEITRILSYRQQGNYQDNPYLRVLPTNRKKG